MAQSAAKATLPPLLEVSQKFIVAYRAHVLRKLPELLPLVIFFAVMTQFFHVEQNDCRPYFVEFLVKNRFFSHDDTIFYPCQFKRTIDVMMTLLFSKSFQSFASKRLQVTTMAIQEKWNQIGGHSVDVSLRTLPKDRPEDPPFLVSFCTLEETRGIRVEKLPDYDITRDPEALTFALVDALQQIHQQQQLHVKPRALQRNPSLPPFIQGTPQSTNTPASSPQKKKKKVHPQGDGRSSSCSIGEVDLSCTQSGLDFDETHQRSGGPSGNVELQAGESEAGVMKVIPLMTPRTTTVGRKLVALSIEILRHLQDAPQDFPFIRGLIQSDATDQSSIRKYFTTCVDRVVTSLQTTFSTLSPSLSALLQSYIDQIVPPK